MCAKGPDVRAAVRDLLPEVVASMAKKAIEGDVDAARLLLECAGSPPQTGQSLVKVESPADGTITSHAVAVLRAAFDGVIAPVDAVHLLAGIGVLTKFVETDQLIARIAALEQRQVEPVAWTTH